MNKGKWFADYFQEIAFDGLTGSEYPVDVPCVSNPTHRDSLSYLEFIKYTNELEALATAVVDAWYTPAANYDGFVRKVNRLGHHIDRRPE